MAMGTHPRIIPARAGPTPPVLRHGFSTPDHPRACGANESGNAHTRHRGGSSPRVRGQLRHPHRIPAQRRIIPARAGPTFLGCGDLGEHADHPRACGANELPVGDAADTHGSSPRVRGQPDGRRDGKDTFRIIPARAGPTCLPSAAVVKNSDHPRACGANLLAVRGSCQKFGSSPRVRGQPPGFISGMKRNADHPRACGANHKELLADMQKVGSSPRVRGQRHSLVVGAPRSRIIPARAGPTTP